MTSLREIMDPIANAEQEIMVPLRFASRMTGYRMTFLKPNSYFLLLLFLRDDAHVDGAEYCSAEASEEDAEFCRILVRAVFKGKASHKQGHRKPDTGKHAATPQHFPGVTRLLGNANLYGQEAEEEYSYRLTENEGERNSAKHGHIETAELDFDTGICKRKNRHDTKVHPRHKHLVQAFLQRNTFACPALEHRKHFVLFIAVLRLARKHIAHATCELGHHAFRHHGLSRHGEAKEHARNRRVHTGLDKERPHGNTREMQQQHIAHANAEENIEQGEEHKGHSKSAKVDAVAARVANRNHENRTDIVCNRQGQNHHAERMRHLLAQNSHAADHERDIRRRRDSPAVRRSRRAKRQVNQSGEQHTARRGDNREARRLRVVEFAVGHFAFDFEPDVEEEYRHQRVVDEPVQIARAHPAANRHHERQMPKVFIGFWREVRPDEGRKRHNDKHYAARRLHLHQAFNRGDNLTYRGFRKHVFNFIAASYSC